MPSLPQLVNYAKRMQDFYFGPVDENTNGTPAVTGDPLSQNKPRRQNFMARGATTVINLNGIVDAESARRSIEQVLQSSSIRTVPVQVQGSLI